MSLLNASHKELIEAAKNDGLVIFAGAGISKSVGLPLWEELILKIIEHINNNDSHHGTTLRAIFNNKSSKNKIFDTLTFIEQNNLNEFVNYILSSEIFKKGNTLIADNIALPLHSKLWQLSKKIITPNYDILFESCNEFKGFNVQPISNKSILNLSNISTSPKYLLKIHGNISEIADIIFYKSQYDNQYKHDTAIKFKFKELVANHPILFVGTSMTDPYINEIIQQVNSIFHNTSAQNFILSSQQHDTANIIKIEGDPINDLNLLLDELLYEKGIGPAIPNTKVTKKYGNSFVEFTKEYWDSLRGKKSKEDLIKYYTNVNSSPLLLPYVVAEEFYIEPDEEIVIKSVSSNHESLKVNLDTLLPKETGSHNCIIRINANGGTGKSTLLHHIGKKYFEKYHILFFIEIPIVSTFPAFSNDKTPVIILLDNYGRHLEKLKQFTQTLNEIYFERGYCLITTERHIREKFLDSEIKNEIDENFSEVIYCSINHSSVFYEKVFEKIIKFVDKNNKLSLETKLDLGAVFVGNSKATTAERIIDFLISIKHSNIGYQFTFDWEDWEKLCEENSILSNYFNLYSIVAAFNKYDITPPIKFCIDLLSINDPYLIKTYSIFSESNFDFPISIQKDKCFELRNPNLAKWYIKERDSLGLLTKKYFKEGLGKCKTYEQMYFLRNTYRNHQVLGDNNLKGLIPNSETLLKLFNDYIITNPSDLDNFKNKMEMVVINLRNHNKANAKVILYEIIADNKEDIHSRTMLAGILIQDHEYEEAKSIVNYLTEKDPTNNYILKLRISILKNTVNEISAIKELLKVLPKENTANIKYLYAKLAKLLRLSGDLRGAEKYCNKLLEFNSSDYAAMNMLAIIYQKQDKLGEAEELLLRSINIQPYNAHNYNELGQVYLQFYSNTRKIEFKYKAFDSFIRGIRIVKDNVALRTEFARFLMSYCEKFNVAKNILQYNIQLEPNHLISYTELGKLYQKQNLFLKSKEILEEGRKHIPKGIVKDENIPMLVVLGNTYIELGEFDKAEELFEITLDLKQDNWISFIGIAKAFLKQNKIHNYKIEFEKILNIVTDIVSLCDFANWLRGNNRIDDSKLIITKAKELNGDKENFYINTIFAGILLEKILYINKSNTLEAIKLYGQCESTCLQTLATKPKHEQTLHILYRLNLFFRGKTKENFYLRSSYSNKYKKYLGILFLVNRTNSYVFEGITQHLSSIRRYRLGIAFIKKYGNLSKYPYHYIRQLAILFSFLENKIELSSLKEFANINKFSLPNIKLSQNIELISQDNIGFLIKDKIESENKIYNISIKNRNLNIKAEDLSKQSMKGIKVYFGIYSYNGNLVANCIEPFFDSIPDDYTVLKLFELDLESKFVSSKKLMWHKY